jgi:AraC-like DNA-binding protein
VQIQRAPAPALRGQVSRYYGFAAAPMRRREGPGADVLLTIGFGEEWLIDGTRATSFVAGLHERQVTTEHRRRALGMQVNLAPPAAYRLLGLPLDTLAHRVVPLEDVLDEPHLVERLYDLGDWTARFELLDALLERRLADARPASAEVGWAWRRLVESEGRLAVGELAAELGWSRKRIVARFREEVGLPPKSAARLLRFEHVRAEAERAQRPDWARLAVECGYYDQSHLINDFRERTGLTPATFFQDAMVPAA